VRLDHLLSKERLPAPVWGGSGARAPRMWGWGCSYGGDTGELLSTATVVVSTARPLRGWVGKAGAVGVGGGVGTLLGPEGTNPVGVVLDGHLRLVRRLLPWWGWVRAGGCGWLLVENCTVDASIFVVKLLRAHGGCLGTRSR
jgi:hypothetical protein